MNENCPLPAAVRNVGRSGKIAIPHSVPKAVRVKKGSNRQLRSSALLPDPAQTLRSLRVENQRGFWLLSGTAVSLSGHASNDRTHRLIPHVGQVKLERGKETGRKTKFGFPCS